MNRFVLCWPDFRKKALTLSYDDGVAQDERLMQIMDAHGIKGTFNINGRDFTEDRPGDLSHERLSRSKAQELYNTPEHEVALHSYHHPFLTQLPAGNAAYEIIKDRQVLEEMFGSIIRGMAYPMGDYNDDLVTTLAQCGVVYSRTIRDTHNFRLPEDWLRWHPTCRHRSEKLPQLCDQFLSNKIGFRAPQLFYLWGHSYEFDTDNNWHVIEQFCRKMGGREDIWYATNMDIYTYLSAGRSIVASVDGRRLYNPTLVTLYLQTETEQVLLAPGQTIQL